MIAIVVVLALPVAVLTFDWMRTQRIKKALAAGGRTPSAGAPHHVDTRPNYDAIAHQATSMRNRTSGPTI